MPLLFNTPLCDSPPPSDEVQLVSLSSKAFSELPPPPLEHTHSVVSLALTPGAPRSSPLPLKPLRTGASRDLYMLFLLSGLPLPTSLSESTRLSP